MGNKESNWHSLKDSGILYLQSAASSGTGSFTSIFVQVQLVCRAQQLYWPMASVTVMIFILNWEIPYKTHCQKAHLCMLYKAITCLVNISMDHYQPSISTFSRSFHGQHLLLPRHKTDTQLQYSFFPQCNNHSVEPFAQRNHQVQTFAHFPAGTMLQLANLLLKLT